MGTTIEYKATGTLVVISPTSGYFTCSVEVPDAWLAGKKADFANGSYDAATNTLTFKSTNIDFQSSDPPTPGASLCTLPNLNVDPSRILQAVTLIVLGKNNINGKVKTGRVINTPPNLGR